MSAHVLDHLQRTDPVMARLIAHVGPYDLRPRVRGTHFGALARSIVFQQLSGKAASTILRRWHALYDGREPSPAQVLSTSPADLRRAGLSNQKARYIQDLASHFIEGRLPTARLGRLSDADVISALTAVKGIGEWTAQMFLIFRLGRPDVLPATDLGIQNAVQRAYGLRRRPEPQRVQHIGAGWAPFRTAASWYLWRSLEPEI
jgi:DNA-3-methyladenine glycosylase II